MKHLKTILHFTLASQLQNVDTPDAADEDAGAANKLPKLGVG